MKIITFCWTLQLLLSVDGCLIHALDRSSNRIVGGHSAPDSHARFQCSLQVDFFRHIHISGCSIISDKWAVTAARCVTEKYSPKKFSILVGTNDLKKGGTRYQVDKYIWHENYDSPRHANDIAVVRVRGSIEFNEKVQPIDFSREEVPDNTKLELTGWGRTDRNAKKCGADRITLTPGHICTFTRRGEGACKGDYGSPLVWHRDSEVQLIGVASLVVPCAKGYPDIYIKVSYYYDWIKKQTS